MACAWSSTRTCASLLPTSESDARISSVAGWPAGQVKRATPVRMVALNCTFAPLSSVTWYAPARAVSCRANTCWRTRCRRRPPTATQSTG